jgi:hypothetical protein
MICLLVFEVGNGSGEAVVEAAPECAVELCKAGDFCGSGTSLAPAALRKSLRDEER